jgi:hypothetical protein
MPSSRTGRTTQQPATQSWALSPTPIAADRHSPAPAHSSTGWWQALAALLKALVVRVPPLSLQPARSPQASNRPCATDDDGGPVMGCAARTCSSGPARITAVRATVPSSSESPLPEAQSLDHGRQPIVWFRRTAVTKFGWCQTLAATAHTWIGRVHCSAAGSIDYQRDTSAVHRRRQRFNHGSRVYGKTTAFLSNDVPSLLIPLRVPQLKTSWPLSNSSSHSGTRRRGILHAQVRPVRMETLIFILTEASLSPLHRC